MTAQVLALRKHVVAPEVAEEEFARLCAAQRIYEEDIEDAERAQFETWKRPILRAILQGQLTVDDRGLATFTPPTANATAITFYTATGATYMAMDSDRHQGNFDRTVAAATEMTRSPKGLISKLEAPDFQVVSAMVGLFLAQR